VAISSVIPRHRFYVVGLLLLAAAPVALAGPGFIESSRVSGTTSGADIEIAFNCKAEYLRHEPQGRGDRLRIYLDPTSICNGVSPLVASSRSILRPVNADEAHLADLEYDGDSAGGPVLTLSFDEPVAYSVESSGVSFQIVVHVLPLAPATATPDVRPAVEHRQVPRSKPISPEYVINLASFRRIPTAADAPGLQAAAGQRIYYSEAEVNGKTSYRLRLGSLKSADDALTRLTALQIESRLANGRCAQNHGGR
jgi:hypothetical protein